ncbi:sensor histidine kinase [Fredinandcohnia humi]
MILLLSVVILILVLIILWQSLSRRKIKRDLVEISNTLNTIIKLESAEKVLMQTDQKVIQQFLIQINRLLDYNHKVIADYSKTKESLRKMLSNISHDLKTPLTVILGYVEKLKIDQMLTPEERDEVINRLHQKTIDVINLMNQFFDLVKIESDGYMLPLKKLSINEMCRKNVLEFYELLKAKGLQVKIEIPEQDFDILGNEEAINRILNNLISNSIRYGSDGGVFGITVREDGDSVAIDVWDRGKGIEAHHQEHVFERLYTLDDARNPHFQGSGLGLSITKSLVEAMKGSIHLSSTPYERTVFTCKFRRLTY